MVRNLFLSTALVTVLALPAWASDVVARSGQHDTHTRIVFEGAVNSAYDFKQETPTKLVIDFRDIDAVNISGIEKDTTLTAVQAQGSAVTLDIAAGSTFRHFLVGKKIVVDIFKPEGNKAAANTTVPVNKQEAPSAKKVVQDGHAADATKTAEMPAESVEPVEKTSLEKAMPDIEPHVITISSTQSFGLAAFIDSGYLWLVLDRKTVGIPPQIAGPQAKMFSAFVPHELQNEGMAYSMKIPEGVSEDIRAEGGGLQWRVVIPTTRKEQKAAKAERQFVQGQMIRGGSIFWPLSGITKVVDLTSPITGENMRVVTVDASTQYTGSAQNFVDFEMKPAAAGAAFVPKVDDLEIETSARGLTVTRPLGLAISRIKDINRHQMREDVSSMEMEKDDHGTAEMKRIFDFDRWMMGGLSALHDNERILMSTIMQKEPEGRIQDLLTLAKMDIANDRGQEALGYLNIAQDDMPQLADNLEYLTLKGAAYALSGKYEVAWESLSKPELDNFGELGYWRAYTLAWLEDWDQAYKNLPKSIEVLSTYPRPLLEKIALKLAEVALRGGDPSLADKLLILLERERSTLKPWTVAGLDYLRGESARQAKDIEGARKLWEPLVNGKDRLYRARSGLALTLLELQDGKINPDKAIDRLEGLRYAWRGDELEAQINYMLGRMYLDQDRYVKGFSILRDAATMALPDSNIGKEIARYMSATYQELIVEDKNLTPVDAATIYEEFKELTPSGEEGNAVIQRLAERLLEADLLNRASSLLQHQVDFRLEGKEKARVAVRLAGVYLLDKNPRPAMKALETAQGIYDADKELSEAQRKEYNREIALLKARALSKINRTEDAIALLNTFEPDPDVNALRADISWQAGLWDDAGEALQDLILDETLDGRRPLTVKQADLLLNRAVALNLAGNRVALASMRTEFENAMNQTTRGKLFEVITRPRKVPTVSDRETIAKIVSEVDLFNGFLDSYRKDNAAPAADTPTSN